MSAREYSQESWIDPRLEVRPSNLEGKGLYVREAIKVNELVVIWGGIMFTQDEIKSGKAKPHTVAEIDEGVYLAAPLNAPDSPDDFMNHSCDPNVWMQDEVTLIARRNIAAGEELTADYAFWSSDPDWLLQPCRCGSRLCRITITGADWKLQELQTRYRGRFSPYINRLIERQTQDM